METKTIVTWLQAVLAVIFCNLVNAQGNSKLPFLIDYNLPLKVTSTDKYQKYDFTEYSAGDDIIQLKTYHNFNREEALKIIQARVFFLNLSFKDQVNPYPGVLSNTIGCPDDEKPKPAEDTVAIRLDYKLLATSNLVYGNCNINDNYYYCLYTVFYCAAKNELYELKIFSPIKKPSFDYETLKKSIQCN